MKEAKKQESKNIARANLIEQFQKLDAQEDAPEELKTEVFKTLETISVLTNVVDLFTEKFPSPEKIILNDSADTVLPDDERDNIP